MSTAQALETEPQRFHGPDADEPPAGPHEPVGERIGRTLTALPGIGGPLRHPDGLVLENGEQPDGPFVHGIRTAGRSPAANASLGGPASTPTRPAR